MEEHEQRVAAALDEIRTLRRTPRMGVARQIDQRMQNMQALSEAQKILADATLELFPDHPVALKIKAAMDELGKVYVP